MGNQIQGFRKFNEKKDGWNDQILRRFIKSLRKKEWKE